MAPGRGVVMLLANVEGSVGGSQRQASLLAHEVAGRGMRAIVVSQSARLWPRRRSVDGDGVERVGLPVLARCARASFLLSFLGWALVNRARFDVIHAHSTSAGLTAGLVGRLLGKPVVVKVTGMQAVTALADRRPAWRLRRWLLNATAQVVVAVSEEMLHALSAARIGDARRLLIPNGVRTAVTAGARESDTPDGAGEAAGPIVLYVGRLEEVKGLRALLRMWAAMPRPHPATLLLVGDGPLRGELEADVAARGLNTSVRFLGTQRDVTPVYRRADVFVLPSLTEGLSNALLEAMVAGLPVVASDVGGNREVLEHGVNGFLVDWRDPALPAALVSRLLGDARLRERIGQAARGRAAGYSISAVAERYCRLYRSLVVRPPGLSRPEAAR